MLAVLDVVDAIKDVTKDELSQRGDTSNTGNIDSADSQAETPVRPDLSACAQEDQKAASESLPPNSCTEANDQSMRIVIGQTARESFRDSNKGEVHTAISEIRDNREIDANGKDKANLSSMAIIQTPLSSSGPATRIGPHGNVRNARFHPLPPKKNTFCTSSFWR